MLVGDEMKVTHKLDERARMMEICIAQKRGRMFTGTKVMKLKGIVVASVTWFWIMSIVHYGKYKFRCRWDSFGAYLGI